MRHFLYQLKRVKIKDILVLWKLPISFICSFFYKFKHRDLWLVCEDIYEARDNGYWFYKYVKEEHPEQECIYAISEKSPDIYKINKIGKWVKYGSLKHWIMYLAASKKISSQKSGNPNPAIFYLLEVYLGLNKNNRVFLQHGVIKDDLKWLYYDVTKMKRFICGAYPEYKYIKNTYGYPKGNVCYTGLCRFDGLHDFCTDKNLILIMPTWREWIADEDYRLQKYEGTTDITKTEYFKTWNEFVKDDHIKMLSEKYGVKFVFFPHRNMQKYMYSFTESNEYIEIADSTKYDVQELMKRSSMMITDYSSVFFDMFYMKKPVVFYQFDYEKFRIAQYKEGYFHYENNPFAKSFRDRISVFDEIEKLIQKEFLVDDVFLKAHNEYFPLFDTNNSMRVYEVVKEIK